MLIVSLFIAKVSFDYINDAYLSYLPNTQTLDKYINAVQSEISTFRRQYTDALEKSLIFAIVIFLISFSVMEYVFRTLPNQSNINRRKSFNSEMEHLQPIIDEINELAEDVPIDPPRRKRTTEIDYSQYQKK